MSNFDQSNMKQDCPNQRDCLEMLQLIIDGEATPEQKDHFMKHHLEGCMPCYQTYHLEIKIKALLKEKCCNGHAPEDLINTIKNQVNGAR